MILPLASVSTSFDTEIVNRGELPALLLLISFGVTFGVTRFITHSIRSDRFAWLGNVEAGDTHIHHLVWGICLLLISGLLAVAVQPPLGGDGDHLRDRSGPDARRVCALAAPRRRLLV